MCGVYVTQYKPERMCTCIYYRTVNKRYKVTGAHWRRQRQSMKTDSVSSTGGAQYTDTGSRDDAWRKRVMHNDGVLVVMMMMLVKLL
jgi:hypothetical protein